MHELVQQHVVPHLVRHLHEPPVQADPSVGRAGPPARALVADAHALHGEAVRRRELAQAPGQDGARRGPQPVPDGIVHAAVLEPHDIAADPDRVGVARPLAAPRGERRRRARCRRSRARGSGPERPAASPVRARSTRGARRRNGARRAGCRGAARSPRLRLRPTAGARSGGRADGARTATVPPRPRRRPRRAARGSDRPGAAATVAALRHPSSAAWRGIILLSHARAARHRALPSRARSPSRRPTHRPRARGVAVPGAQRRAAARRARRAAGRRRGTRRQADRARARRRRVRRDSPDDRGPAALEAAPVRCRAPARRWRGSSSITACSSSTEAGSKRRASLTLVRGQIRARRAQPRRDRRVQRLPGGVRGSAAAENHTFKRALTDPRIFDGIGNAYSDEILHAARLSPLMLTSRMTDDQIAASPRGGDGDAHGVDRPAAAGHRRRLPGEGHRLSRRDGRARPVRQAVPALRIAGAADQLCRPRVQLLRGVSARRTPAG